MRNKSLCKRILVGIMAAAMTFSTVAPVGYIYAAEEAQIIEDVTSTGLDLYTSVPTEETVYKAGNGTITFIPATENARAKIVLNNAEINSGKEDTWESSTSNNGYEGIRLKADTEYDIELIGTNTFRYLYECIADGNSTTSSAKEPHVYITGDGSMEVIDCKFGINGIDIDTDGVTINGTNVQSALIYAYNGYIKNTKINAETKGKLSTGALDTYKTLTIEKSNVVINSATYGVRCEPSSVSQVKIIDSNLSVLSGTYGLCDFKGINPIVIEDSKVTINTTYGVRSLGSIEIKGTSDVSVTAGTTAGAVRADSGNITISDTAKVKTYGGVGLYLAKSDGKVIVKGTPDITSIGAIRAVNRTVDVSEYAEPGCRTDVNAEAIEDGAAQWDGETDITTYKYMHIAPKPHEHNWNYQQPQKNTVNVWCDSEYKADDCNYQGETHALTFVLTAKDEDYTGDHYAGADIVNNITSATGAVQGVMYYEGVGDTVYEKSDIAPVNAGTYKVSVTIGTFTAEAEFQIKKVDSEYAVPMANELTYNGASQKLVTEGTASYGKMLYKLEGGEWSEDIPEAVNAGEYKVYYKVEGDINHNDSEEGCITAAIARKEIVVSGIKAENKIYDGTLDAALAYEDVVFEGKIDGDELEVTANGEFDTANAGTDKTVYIGNIKLGGSSVDNYKLAAQGQQDTAMADIVKAQSDLQVTKTITKIYGDEAFDLGCASLGDGDKTYSSNNEKVVRVDEYGKVTIVGAGKSVITVSQAETGNYESAEAQITVTVARKAVTLTVSNASKLTGKADPKFTYKVSGLVGGDRLTGITIKRKAGEKAGTYVITATQASGANANYRISVKTGVFTIKQSDQSKLTGNDVAKLSIPLLIARGKGGNGSISVAWLKCSDATGYDCYWSYCDGKQNYKKFADVKNGKLNTTHSRLQNNREYKYFVAAYKIEGGRKVYIARSNSLHVAMKQSKLTNASELVPNRTSATLTVGKTVKITGKIKLENPKKKQLHHVAEYRYYTSNSKVAAVSASGVVTAKGKGSCRIYVVANNGVYKTVTVTVK